MFAGMKNMNILGVVKGKSILRNTITDRSSHAIVFKISGETKYTFKNKILSLKENGVLFIPKGASYSLELVSEESEYVFINFEAEFSPNEPELYSLRGYEGKDFLYQRLQKSWVLGTEAEKYKCYALFYHVLSFLNQKEEQQYMPNHKYALIAPAIQYIEAHIFDCNLKIEQLSSLCNISDTYFRRIFKAVYGQTPQSYVMHVRLSQAANILVSGEYGSIKDVSETVGYPDALYFSRIFLKKYGVRPSAYQEYK